LNPTSPPKVEAPCLHLHSGVWRANKRHRVPESTITQAPEPVKTPHSCGRGNIYISTYVVLQSIIPRTYTYVPTAYAVAGCSWTAIDALKMTQRAATHHQMARG
jgi:hypothetical protein